MPLDYQLWSVIEKRMKESTPEGSETKAEYLARLRKMATTLPKGTVVDAINKMKDNLQGIVKAKGFHAKRD